MVKKLKPEGAEILLPKETVEQIPIELSQKQAKTLLKKLNPPKPRSDKQKQNIQKLVEANKQKWDKAREEKTKAEQRAKEELEKASKKIIVKPLVKRGPRKKPIQPIEEEEEEDDDDEEEALLPAKKSSKKAMELVDTVNKLDEKINQLKTSNRYDKLLRF